MKKAVVIATGILIVISIGFLAPPLIVPPSELGSELHGNYQSAAEPFGPFLLTAKILHDQDTNYANRCNSQTTSVLLQSYTWMFIPGPVIEACVFQNESGDITGMKSIGIIERKR